MSPTPPMLSRRLQARRRLQLRLDIDSAGSAAATGRSEVGGRRCDGGTRRWARSWFRAGQTAPLRTPPPMAHLGEDARRPRDARVLQIAAAGHTRAPARRDRRGWAQPAGSRQDTIATPASRAFVGASTGDIDVVSAPRAYADRRRRAVLWGDNLPCSRTQSTSSSREPVRGQLSDALSVSVGSPHAVQFARAAE